MNTLIITDIDAKNPNGKNANPKRGIGQKTRNETIKSWVPKQESLDLALDMNECDLLVEDPSGYAVRVAYQQPITITFKSDINIEGLAYTFEDALVYQNLELFKDLTGNGLIKKFRTAITSSLDFSQLANSIREDLKDGSKAEFSLDLLLSDEIEKLQAPEYIHKGLLWLASQLKRKEEDVTGNTLRV